MGRIVVQTKITNLFDEEKFIRCGMLVDTGAGALILPSAWKERLGEFKRSAEFRGRGRVSRFPNG